jgi:hypothetical protein
MGIPKKAFEITRRAGADAVRQYFLPLVALGTLVKRFVRGVVRTADDHRAGADARAGKGPGATIALELLVGPQAHDPPTDEAARSQHRSVRRSLVVRLSAAGCPWEVHEPAGEYDVDVVVSLRQEGVSDLVAALEEWFRSEPGAGLVLRRKGGGASVRIASARDTRKLRELVADRG